MAKRETIIEIRIDNQDALNRLGKQQAELLKVRESIKLLNSIIRENGEANNNQARQLGELNVKQEALRKSTSTLAKDLAAVNVASKATVETAKASALETLKQTGALDKLDASTAKNIGQLGKWKAEQILVQKAQADLRKEIQANGAATEAQEKDLGDLATKAKFLSSNLNELTNDTAGLTAAGTRFRDKMAAATLEALKQSGVIGQLDARTVALTADIDKLNAQFEAGTVDTAQYTANLDKLTKELDQTKAATAASEARFNALEAEFRQGKISADQFRASVDLLNKEVKTQGGLLQSGVNDLKSYVLGTIGVVAALQAAVSIVKNGVNSIKEFQQANANLASILGTTREGIAALTDSALKLAPALGRLPKEVVDLQTELAKLGFTESQILDAQEAVILLANATGEELGPSAEIAAGTLKAFGLETDQTQRLVDVMAQSFNNTSLDLNKYATAMSTIAPVARAANVSLEQTTALIGTLSDATIDASTIGTSLRDIFIDLAAKGISLDDALEQINASTDKLSTANELFGKRSATVALVLAENTDKADALTIAFGNAGGAAREMAETQLDTLEGALNRLSSAYDTLLQGNGGIADFFKRRVSELAEFLSVLGGNDKMSQRVSEFTARTQKEYEKLGGTAKLAASEGSKVVQQLRLMAENADAIKGTDPFGVDLLRIQGREAAEILRGIVAEREKLKGTSVSPSFDANLKVEEAAARAVIQVITDKLNARTAASQKEIAVIDEQAAATERAAKRETASLQELQAQLQALKDGSAVKGGVDDGNAKEIADIEARIAALDGEAKSIGALRVELKQAKKDRDALTDPDERAKAAERVNDIAEEIKALEGSAKAAKNAAGSVADLNAQLAKLKALQDQEPGKVQFDEYSKQIAGVQEQLDALTKTASTVAFDPLTPPDTVGVTGSTQEGPLNFDATQAQAAADALIAVKEQEAADLERLREDARVRDIEGIVDLNAEKLLLQKEFEAGSEMSQAEYNANVAALDEALAQQKRNAIASVGDALTAFSALAKKGSAEQKALATAAALVNTYLGVSQVLANPTVIPEPFGTINKIASIATVLATGLAAVRQIQSVQGFAEGGIIQEKHGKPIRRSNGDNRVITAKVDEMILTEEQQREIKRRAGFDIFRLAGVPGANGGDGFIEGGVVSSTLRGSVRGTALVNLGAAPSPGLLDTLQTNAISRAADPNIFVRVTDIDNVQGQRARVLDRATL